MNRKEGAHKGRKKNKKLLKTNQVLYKCLETGAVGRKGKEPELLSGDESSSGDKRFKMMKLPSSCGTSLSSAEEADSEGERFVDSKERENSDEEDMEEEDFVRFRTLKSYDPKFVSPQKLLKVKVA